MMLNGCDYLLRLSILAVSFVGWSAIVVTLRRALGAELSALHMYFVRFFIEAPFGWRTHSVVAILPATAAKRQAPSLENANSARF